MFSSKLSDWPGVLWLFAFVLPAQLSPHLNLVSFLYTSTRDLPNPSKLASRPSSYLALIKARRSEFITH